MSMELYNWGKTCSATFRVYGAKHDAPVLEHMLVRVYSDRTRQRQNAGAKHNALDLEHMLVNRSIQTGRVGSKNLYNRDAVDLCWRVRSE